MYYVREDFIINGWYRLFPSASFTTTFASRYAVLAQVHIFFFWATRSPAAEVVLNIAPPPPLVPFQSLKAARWKSTLNKN